VHLRKRQDKLILLQRLDAAGFLTWFNLDDVPLGSDGRPLLNGLMTVRKNDLTDRLILVRCPANSQFTPAVSTPGVMGCKSDYPHGTCWTDVVLPSSRDMRFSVLDLA
jgi:hypothetical protein